MAHNLWTSTSVRLRIACAIALALTIEGLMRSNLNMAIVCMLNSTALMDGKQAVSSNNTTVTVNQSCPLLVFGGEKQPIEHRGTIYWSSQERAIIFASFYVGGLVSTIFSEKLNRSIGASRTVLYGALANVIGTFLTPSVAAATSEFGTIPIIFVRFIMGFGQGVLWPCMSVLVANWFPAEEKSTALAIATTGNQLSVVISMFATAELCQLPVGWPMAFHVYGFAGIVLCVVWYAIVVDTPQDSKCISDSELEHITSSTIKRKVQKANWSALLSSPVVWSIAASSFAHNYITVGTVTYLPLYYRTVLNMSLTSNGILSALPFFGQFLSKVAYAGLADKAKKKKWIGFDSVTKICNSSASFGMAICFGLLCFVDCSQRIVAIFLIIIAMAFVSGYIPGYNTCIVTIAPTQTAAIASFTRLWAQIASSLAPYHIGATTKQGIAEEWRLVFMTISIMCVITGTFFQLCGSANLQSWDSEKNSKRPLEIGREDLIDKSKLDEPTTKQAFADDVESNSTCPLK